MYILQNPAPQLPTTYVEDTADIALHCAVQYASTRDAVRENV